MTPETVLPESLMSHSIRPDAPAPHLRWAGPWDAEILAALHAEAFDEGWTAEDIAGLMNLPGGFAIMIEQDGPAAFALARSAAGEAELLTLAVAPRARRQGFARRLVEAVAAQSEELGADVLFLEVASNNPGAQALYAQAGFTQAGVRPEYYAWRDGMSADALVMRRALNTPGA